MEHLGNEGLNSLSNQAINPFFMVAKTGNEASAHHQNQSASHRELFQTLNYSEWMARSLKNGVDASTAQLQKGLTFLASTGATAPFIGLFGTVWGIYHALTAIGISGQASIDKVAGPVGEALVMTAAGLAVALPAVLAYNLLGRAAAQMEALLEGFAHDLQSMFGTQPAEQAPHDDGMAVAGLPAGPMEAP